MARPAMGVRWGGEASGAAQPAAGGGSRQSRRRLFERLEQEEQRLKKHDSRSMDIQQSLLSCALFLIMYNPFANS